MLGLLEDGVGTQWALRHKAVACVRGVRAGLHRECGGAGEHLFLAEVFAGGETALDMPSNFHRFGKARGSDQVGTTQPLQGALPEPEAWGKGFPI